ncbi:gluconokinase [Arthrobacter sp. H14-L1]|uniref:gluconokinase n=1 Tax=Arthrobacter sp. H14-L1 TaxID=2996697 RepID=UPI00226EEA07|nr:gluconokinase [Arthrobacter sp. H14-L1]MCY0906100.1 gluconokinase [Arthrobacter sp. H14-L1]
MSSTRLVVMGVSGCGKSTIGSLVAHALGIPFVDGDSLHSVENVAKMAAGTPLTDADRRPWLAVVGRALAQTDGPGLVVACSALKRSYRDAIRAQASDVFFLHLHGTRELLSTRLARRAGHFMPADLLDSQLATLQPLQPDETGYAVDIDQPVSEILKQAVLAAGSGIQTEAVAAAVR